MILVVGATGTLGGHVARLLREKGLPVRAMTRDPARASTLAALGAEVVQGDLCDADSVRAATRGVHTVVSSSHAILGTGRNSHERVDDQGQRTLVAAARDAGVAHFVYVSATGASPSHPVDFWRTKERIERHLEDSGLHHTIIRPTAFMGVHAYDLIGKAVVSGSRVLMFGAGDNPRNFVAEIDVARLLVATLEDDHLQGGTLEIGGPENLTGKQVAETFARVANRPARVTHVPLWALRMMVPLARPLHAGVGRALAATVVGETTDQRFDPAPLLARYPMRLTPLEEWARARAAR